MSLEGLKSAIETREAKATNNREQRSRLDNAKCHYHNALEEIKRGFKSIEQFDHEL